MIRSLGSGGGLLMYLDSKIFGWTPLRKAWGLVSKRDIYCSMGVETGLSWRGTRRPNPFGET